MFKYTHVLRIDSEEIDKRAYLTGDVYIQPKLDGSNGSIYFDGHNFIIQSRTRRITIDKDNMGFADYMLNNENVEDIREFCKAHPFICVYGEWLGGIDGRKFLGQIKSYENGGFFPFDLKNITGFNVEQIYNGQYIPPSNTIYQEFDKSVGFVPMIVHLINPTYEDVMSYVDKCTFNLPDGMIGEGIVIKNYDYIDRWGDHKFCKVVRAESREVRQSHTQSLINKIGVEPAIIEKFVNDGKLAKSKNKCLLVQDKDVWSNSDEALVGMLMNLAFKDLVEEDLSARALKSLGYPVINFSILKKLCFDRVRVFLNL